MTCDGGQPSPVESVFRGPAVHNHDLGRAFFSARIGRERRGAHHVSIGRVATLDAIRGRVEVLAGEIEAPSELLPIYGRSEDGARPHIEVGSDGRMAWVVIERGAEIEGRST